MNTVTLQDPQSGALVYIRTADLRQKCRVCGLPLEGELACATDSKGWACLHHLPEVLLTLPMSADFVGRAAVRRELEGKAPGDKVTVTGSLLAALGVGR